MNTFLHYTFSMVCSGKMYFLFLDYNKKQEQLKQRLHSVSCMSDMASFKEKFVSPGNEENVSSTIPDLVSDADAFLAKLTSVPSPSASDYSDYGSMVNTPGSVSGKN